MPFIVSRLSALRKNLVTKKMLKLFSAKSPIRAVQFVYNPPIEIIRFKFGVDISWPAIFVSFVITVTFLSEVSMFLKFQVSLILNQFLECQILS